MVCPLFPLQVDIPAGTELTYDYRLAGDARLPCNFGAATCCGLVNESRSLVCFMPAQLAACVPSIHAEDPCAIGDCIILWHRAGTELRHLDPNL